MRHLLAARDAPSTRWRSVGNRTRYPGSRELTGIMRLTNLPLFYPDYEGDMPVRSKQEV